MKKKLFTRKAKTLVLQLPYFKQMQAKSHKVISIGDKLFYRKDQVESIVADVINVKIEKGELIKPASNAKT